VTCAVDGRQQAAGIVAVSEVDGVPFVLGETERPKEATEAPRAKRALQHLR